MILRGPATSLAVIIEAGPDSEGWYRIQINVDAPAGCWSAQNACLTGTEVEELADWLEQVVDGTAATRLEFLEPELALQRSAAGVQVELRWGLQPTPAPGDPHEPLIVTIPAEPGQLVRAAHSLRSDLARR